MKSINFKSFLFGTVFSFILIGFFAFTNHSNKISSFQGEETVKGVSPETAQTYKYNYKGLYPDKLNAINLSVQQWNAINHEVQQKDNNLTNVSGFRLYFGAKTASPDAEIVSLVYTINSDLREQPPGSSVNMAEGFNASYDQQCPPFCD